MAARATLEGSADAELELARELEQRADLRVEVADLGRAVRVVEVPEDVVVQAGVRPLRGVVEEVEDLQVRLNRDALLDVDRARDAQIHVEAALERPRVVLG